MRLFMSVNLSYILNTPYLKPVQSNILSFMGGKEQADFLCVNQRLSRVVEKLLLKQAHSVSSITTKQVTVRDTFRKTLLAWTPLSKGIPLTKKEQVQYALSRKAMIKDLIKRVDDDCYLLDFNVLYTHLANHTKAVRLLLRRWYGTLFYTKLERVFKKFSLSQEYYLLFLQPGIACRLKQFYHFLADSSPAFSTPAELRSLFRKHLGDQIFFRGVFLTRQEIMDFQSKTKCYKNKICREYPEAAFPGYAKKNLEHTFNELFRLDGSSYEIFMGSCNTMVDQYCSTTATFGAFRNLNPVEDLTAPFIPMSQYYDVAAQVPYWYSREGNEHKCLAILTIQLPLIETISETGPFFFESIMNGVLFLKDFQGNRKIFSLMTEEHLIYGNIPSKQILKVTPGYRPQEKLKLLTTYRPNLFPYVSLSSQYASIRY
jgi:hypothetical protein